jgi:hypothetical protein
LIKNRGNFTSSSFLKGEAGALFEAGVLMIPDSAAEGVVGLFKEDGLALSNAQKAFVRSHPAVIKSLCALFCPG